MKISTKNQRSIEAPPNVDALMHVTGKAIYLDDLPEMEGMLYAAFVTSTVGHGRIISINYDEASRAPGVVKILTCHDIPGQNQIGGIVQDEPLLADGEVHFQGQPILMILAESLHVAEDAAKKVMVEIEAYQVITDPREAYNKGSLLHDSRTFSLGDPKAKFADCVHVFEGRAESGGQEHIYLEGQAAYACPSEHNGVKIHSSTQGPTQVQRAASRVLGVPMHKIEVDVTRLGGGFGGKEDQASCWGAMAAFGTFITQRPVKVVLHRMDDIRMTGKRHPYSSDYKIGLNQDLKIVAFEATYYQNGGAAADLSPAILERTLFHATNSYYIPNVLVTAHSCKTNLPPNTAFRGFGGPQGMFVMEAAIHHASRELNVDTLEIQRNNLLKENDEFCYGQLAQMCEAHSCWSQVVDLYNLENQKDEIDRFNKENTFRKKGLALMPVCFGISFTNTQMNSGRALVHVYSDGSVGVSTGGVEMGQGVNQKMVQVAAKIFGIPFSKIKLETTNTTRVANTSPSAASSTSDLNGKALQDACNQIIDRFKEFIREHFNLQGKVDLQFEGEEVLIRGTDHSMDWKDLVQKAFMNRINLSAKGHYATPAIHFDKATEKGEPFAYHVYGTAIVVAELDCLRGTYVFESVRVVHDFGTSMNREIDLGQCEGGIVQGLGWMTMEEVMYDEKGRLLSDALSTYKIPDIYSAPKQIDVHFLNTDGHPMAIHKSKAVGEPPLMYGIGGYFALYNAILAFNPEATISYSAPMTPEKVLLSLYPVKK